MGVENDSRLEAASSLASALFTPTVEEKCLAQFEKRVIGLDIAVQRLLVREKQAMQMLFAWMQDHGWSGGETPDFDALLIEE